MDCRESACCEHFPNLEAPTAKAKKDEDGVSPFVDTDGTDKLLFESELRASGLAPLKNMAPWKAKHEMRGPQETWRRLIVRYSACKASYPTDTLAALSGIARMLSTSGRLGRYFAGLWETGFESQLCWYVRDRLPRGPYTGSSWSWASVQSAVDIPATINPNIAAEFLDAKCHLGGPDEFGSPGAPGASKDNFLKIRAPALLVRVPKFEQTERGEMQWNQKPFTNIVFDSEDDFHENLSGHFGWFLCLFRQMQRGHPIQTGDHYTKCIVVREILNEGQLIFARRIGFMQSDWESVEIADERVFVIV